MQVAASSYFDEVSRVVHSQDSQLRAFGMMTLARCDESADTRGQPFAYVVSGYLGWQVDFLELERKWRIALDREGIEEFHMAKLENRLPPYEHLERDQRDHLQRVFIKLIIEARIYGFACAIDLRNYNAIIDKIRVKRGDFAHPYYLAFQHTVEEMALELEKPNVPKDECIAFAFDQQKEFEGNAKELYDSLSQSDFRYARRLGPLVFDSRKKILALQASDVLAYENLRYVREVHFGGQPERWQMKLLRSTGQLKGSLIGQGSINILAHDEGWS